MRPPSPQMKLTLLPFLRRRLVYQWRHQFTASGRMMAVAIIVAVSLGSASLDLPVYPILCGLCGICVSAFVAGFVLRPNAEIIGGIPRKVSAGQPFRVAYTVTNTSRWPVYDLGLGLFDWPKSVRVRDGDCVVSVLAPGESAHFSIEVFPRERGVFALPPVRAYSTFPFGLLRQGRCKRPIGTLIVQPSFHRLERFDVPIGRRYQPGGIALTSGVGESTEYIGNREYTPGDPTRLIDFRSWARLAKPVVKEYQEEYYCRVALVLDTFVPATRGRAARVSPALEAAVSLVASIADALAAGEYLIDIFAAGPNLHVFRAGRSTAHFDNVLEILAGVEPCRTNPFEIVSPALADELGNISTVICVLLDWDADREGLVMRARESGCEVKLIVVRDGATSIPLDSAGDVGIEPVHLFPKEIAEGEVGYL